MCLREVSEERVFLVQVEVLKNQKAVIRVGFFIFLGVANTSRLRDGRQRQRNCWKFGVFVGSLTIFYYFLFVAKIKTVLFCVGCNHHSLRCLLFITIY